MPRASICIVHPSLRFGGSESVALWAIEALKRETQVSLITAGSVDLPRLNAYYGTDIQPGEIKILRAPTPPGLGRLSGLRGAYLQKSCRQIAPQFDLMINTYGPCDFGVPAIQCIADFAFVPEWRDTLHPELANYRRWWYEDSALRRAYLGVCDSISRPNPDAWKRNITLANSHWTADLLKQHFGIDSQVVYPPVTGNFPDIPWEQRENGFVCIGRVVPEKRMDAVIEILSRVRQHGHDVHLHILGGVDDSPFGKKIKRMATERQDWVFLEGLVAGRKKEEMIASHQYGINGRRNEPFGIAPAEMVKAGCITFAPSSGGQTEIVDHPALTFENDDDAVSKIEAALSETTLQETLRRHLAERAHRFSVQAFADSMRQAAASKIGGHARPASASKP